MGIDFVWPNESKSAPYFDGGGEGLGLIEITRKRVYSRSCKWMPSFASTRYLVGKNEAGTYFAHAVPNNIHSVLEALSWVWSNRADKIKERQGDIALVSAIRKHLPDLPRGHSIKGRRILHKQHIAIRLPRKAEAIIIARRAHVTVGSQGRD